MSLVQPNFMEVVKRQYMYKLKAYTDVFVSLIVLQLLAIVFSFGGSGSIGTGSDAISVQVNEYSADIVIMFTFLWAFIISILITTKAYRYDDFVFVTNRLSSHVSNGLFILTTSVVAGICALLSSFLLQVLIYYFFKTPFISGGAYSLTIGEYTVGFVATILYVILFSMCGYFVGMLIQWHKMFIIILPAIFFGDLFVNANKGNKMMLTAGFEVVFTESSFLLFVIKMCVAIMLLYGTTLLFSNQLEVR